MQQNETTIEIAGQQILILSGQDYFRNHKQLIDILIRALIRYADDVDHMKRMVEYWINDTREALHPADVYELSQITAKRVGLPDRCRICWTNSWPRIVERHGCTAVARCECKRGEALATADKARAAEPLPGSDVDDRQLSFLKEFIDIRNQTT